MDEFSLFNDNASLQEMNPPEALDVEFGSSASSSSSSSSSNNSNNSAHPASPHGNNNNFNSYGGNMSASSSSSYEPRTTNSSSAFGSSTPRHSSHGLPSLPRPVSPARDVDNNFRTRSLPPRQPGLEYLTKVLLQALEKDEKAEQARALNTPNSGGAGSSSEITEQQIEPESPGQTHFFQNHSTSNSQNLPSLPSGPSHFLPHVRSSSPVHVKSEPRSSPTTIQSLINDRSYDNRFPVPINYGHRMPEDAPFNRYPPRGELPPDSRYNSFPPERLDAVRYDDSYSNGRRYSDRMNGPQQFAVAPPMYGAPHHTPQLQNSHSNSHPNPNSPFDSSTYHDPRLSGNSDMEIYQNGMYPGPPQPLPTQFEPRFENEKFEDNQTFEDSHHFDDSESEADGSGSNSSSSSLSRKQFRETIGVDFARDLLSGEYSYDEIIGKYRRLYPQFADKFTRNFCSKVRCGRILNTSRTMKQRSVKNGDPRMKRVARISKRKEWTRMTPELFSRILAWEQAHNGVIKQSDIESKFNVNRSTFHRWKKKCNNNGSEFDANGMNSDESVTFTATAGEDG